MWWRVVGREGVVEVWEGGGIGVGWRKEVVHELGVSISLVVGGNW